jgi:hypothetical protein
MLFTFTILYTQVHTKNNVTDISVRANYKSIKAHSMLNTSDLRIIYHTEANYNLIALAHTNPKAQQCYL